ncbi:hypothetical protein RN001_002881 [Aquatica leii]|uniref:Uncharacterized protein n=1 Tax=Aquatica leii TaxID=1421715 RepID=A0AAN7QBA9_9COLE|nr:hypothetical protein RN001_002881 [Aquatica leii]
MEKEFLNKRSDQYLHYVETQLLKGKTIKDIMSEVKSLEHKLPIKLSHINDRVKLEDYYLDRNKELLIYIDNEIDKGRNLDDILAEIRRTVALSMHKNTEKHL